MMTRGSMRHSLAVVELAAGLISIGIAAYYLIEFQFCNPNAALCGPMTMLPVILLLVPGIIVFGAGTMTIRRKVLALWKIQLGMMILIGLYIAILAAWILAYSE